MSAIKDIVGTLANTVTEMDEQIADLKTRRRNVVARFVAHGWRLDEKSRLEAARAMYWSTSKSGEFIFAVSQVGTFLGCHSARVSSMVGPGFVPGHVCPECQELLTVASREEWKQWQRKGLQSQVCRPCQLAIRERTSKASAERWRRQEAAEQAEIERLRALTYREYLKTTHWKETRKAAYKRARYRCQTCNATNVQLQTHHRTYERLGCERRDDLVVLCDACHETFHAHRNLEGGRT